MPAPVRRLGQRDFDAIAAGSPERSRVLDLGCGDGALLRVPRSEARGARGYGIEIDDANVLACVKNGVNVIQRTWRRPRLLRATALRLRDPLADAADDAPDRAILREMVRVGREGIVTFPNFGYWRASPAIMLAGRMPVSESLPYQWYDTPNVHLFTVADFEDLCAKVGAEILEDAWSCRATPMRCCPTCAAAWRCSASSAAGVQVA